MAARCGGLAVDAAPLAHSARLPGGAPHPYAAHIIGVAKGARTRAEAMVKYHRDPSIRGKLAQAILDAATFHDLGKLDPDVQEVLRQTRHAKLRWDHIDAGVAHLQACCANTAAWIVPAHHSPGLPSLPGHFATKRDR